MAVEKRSAWNSWLAPRKLLFYTLFWGFHIGVFILGWYLQQSNEKLAGLNTLKFSVWISRGAGLVLSVDVTLILLPMCRSLLTYIRPKVRWMRLDESQWFHRHVAYSLLIFSIVHTSAHYVNFFNVERSQVRPEGAVQIHYTQAGGITGHIMLLCMLGIYTTAHRNIRKQSYETFWYTHHLFVPFLLGMYTHATGCFVRDTAHPYSPFAGKPFWAHCIGYEGWRWELFAGGLYLIERIYREVKARRPAQIVRVIRHPFDTMEIQISKPSMKYRAGQWLFINVPAVSGHQWHPFTITSCPFDPYISIHVRQVGDFTRALGDAVGVGPAQAKLFEGDELGMFEVQLDEGQEWPMVRLDGPYGAPAEDVFDNEVAVLIGTGIGVTPWASILKNIWHIRSMASSTSVYGSVESVPGASAAAASARRLRRVEFIWICRDTKSFAWFQNLLSALEAQSLEQSEGMGDDFLRIHTYLTKHMDADTAQNIVLNSIGTTKDPLTELRSRTNFGRPDFKRLFTGMRNGIREGTYMPGFEDHHHVEVGVYFCGPSAAGREIKKACQFADSREVRFKMWKEHF